MRLLRMRVGKIEVMTAVMIAVIALPVTARAQVARGAAPPGYDEGQALLSQKRYGEAIDKLRPVTRAQPDFAPGWFALALAARRAGRCADAIPAYRRYAELQPADAEPYFGLGLCLRDTGDRAAAVTALRRFVELERRPGQDKWLETARSLIAGLEPAAVNAPLAGTVPAPVPPVGTGTAPPPMAPLPLTTGAGTGTGAASTGTTTTATTSTTRSTNASTSTSTSGRGNGAYEEAQRLRDAGKIEAALKKFAEVVALDPALISARAAWGELLIKIHREGEAIGVLRAAVERSPEYPLAWYELGFALRETGRFAEAVEAYRRYIALRPADPDPHYGVARALQKLGRDEDAARSFAAYLAMENRPGEERWISSARGQLAALNQRGATRSGATSTSAPAPAPAATSATPADRTPTPPR